MIQLVYWSSTGITRRAAERLGGTSIEHYYGGPYVLMVPSYGAPRTGGHVPPAVKKFLAEHGDELVGVVGMGNTTFGPDYCLGARKIAARWEVPLIEKIDLVATGDQEERIKQFLSS